MARRGREAALKRAQEKARQDKQDAKREKRLARQAEESTEEAVDEQALMEEFARLSERYENSQLTSDQFETERHRIFVALGIEADE